MRDFILLLLVALTIMFIGDISQGIERAALLGWLQ